MILKPGEKLKVQVESAAGRRSISNMTLRRAAADLGVRKYNWTEERIGRCIARDQHLLKNPLPREL